MKLSEITENRLDNIINEQFVNLVETIYSCSLPDFVKHLLSLSGEDIDYETKTGLIRKLSDELITSPEELGGNLIELGFLPLFDLYDNDYLCYDFRNYSWCMFNTVNGLAYNKQLNFSDVLK